VILRDDLVFGRARVTIDEERVVAGLNTEQRSSFGDIEVCLL